LKFKFVI